MLAQLSSANKLLLDCITKQKKKKKKLKPTRFFFDLYLQTGRHYMVFQKLTFP